MVEWDLQREDIINEVPEEWKTNLKKGLCPVCAKEKKDFHKRMRVYCSIECKEKYFSKIRTWGEIREKILKRDNEICQICRLDRKKADEQRDKKSEQHALEVGKNLKDEIEKLRAEKLLESEEAYRDAQDEDWLAIHAGYRKGSRLSLPHVFFEVDHIKEIVDGGEMWDETNLQTLCSDCHKKKTKESKVKRSETK